MRFLEKINYIIVMQVLLLFYLGTLQAQTPSDAVMMKKQELCLAFNYDYGSWNKYWEGDNLRGNENIGTLTRNMWSPMLAYGIIDHLNIIVSTPYIKTKASGGQIKGAEGFQDLNFSLKYMMMNKAMGKGKLAVLATLGFATPMSNYLSDFMPFSIGLGTNELSLRGIIQYRFGNRFYVRSALAHLWRGQTEAERDYYYNNGSYYTSWMDVPNAWNYNGVIGITLFDNSLKLEANYTGLSSTNGDDIRKYNAPQPTNKVEWEQIGFFSQYYF